MTESENPSRVLQVAKEIQLAIQDVPLTATGIEIADALQTIALAAAEQVVPRVEIARTLMTLAERYLKADAVERGAPESRAETAHKAFSAAVQLMALEGVSQAEIRELMLEFAVAWIGKAEGRRVASAALYRWADNLACHRPTKH